MKIHNIFTRFRFVGVGAWVIGAKADPAASLPASEEFISYSGTSQAAPGIAGAAAIIREYLQKGYYPSGIANTSDAVAQPTAALLKAMLIASTRPLDGFSQVWGRCVTNISFSLSFLLILTTFDSKTKLPYSSPYGFATWLDGFGKVALRNVLTFSTSGSSRNVTLVIPNVQQDRVIVTGENHTYCFRSTTSGMVVVVLVSEPSFLMFVINLSFAYVYTSTTLGLARCPRTSCSALSASK